MLFAPGLPRRSHTYAMKPPNTAAPINRPMLPRGKVSPPTWDCQPWVEAETHPGYRIFARPAP